MFKNNSSLAPFPLLIFLIFVSGGKQFRKEAANKLLMLLGKEVYSAK